MIDLPTKYYTGIGSRSTPEDVQNLMTSYAKSLSLYGYVLRSGGAEGADTAFEIGAVRSEIYLPWDNFNGRTGISTIPPKAFDIAERIHPNWDACKDSVRKLHARNVQQIMGQNLDNYSEFVIFWAKETNGQVQGGTRTAVELARKLGIKTYNLYNNKGNVQKLLFNLYLNYMEVTLRHMWLFYQDGINKADDKRIEELLDMDSKGKEEWKEIRTYFKRYKDTNKDSKYLPTDIENI